MRAFALIQALISSPVAGDYSLTSRSGVRIVARRLDRWLDHHGAVLGCLAVVLTFMAAVDLIKHLLALL